ncbi:exonuclease SbcCD subunit D [Demequina sp. SYSU T00068]|uniref:exonuclease SbcCD subunit D n=1 Tax=Demequina lignilytica TaxID=3051663 RepID=UPI0026020402|nr:exonuclease SbcCD subunit D [Demequina sp. SYSU T00068]MDN4491202.1 exonuclease SbcCD subunit D [Demequina sp. SYSU T00068]
MRALHTSDWHIGRTFHGHSTDDHLAQVLAAIAQAVRDHHVDVVIVAGDVFDSSTPKAEAFTMLNSAVRAIRSAGAQVVLTSGNHDGPARLGHLAEFAAFGGVHVLADLRRLAVPVAVPDAHGDVFVYGIPYVHPEFLRGAFEDFDGRTHEAALSFAMDLIRDDARTRGGEGARYVVASHCFASGEAGGGGREVHETTESTGRSEERDITRGGLDIVPPGVFQGPAYTALGHIHSRATLREDLRYSGAPLRFSFGELSSAKGAWLVDIGAAGLEGVEWLELPTPRRAVRLTGTLDHLLSPGVHEEDRDAWVDIVLTDDLRPRDAMRRAQEKFPHAVTLAHRPSTVAAHARETYADRTRGKSDAELIEAFLGFTRNGHGASPEEQDLLADSLQALDAKEATR